MKKKRICLYYITLMLFCQCFLGVVASAYAETSGAAGDLTEGQKHAIVDYCDEIHENLRKVQVKDRQTRVYLGQIYETILGKFLKPLNHRLVDNSMPGFGLDENQSRFAEAQKKFRDDYVVYQQDLAEAISINCRENPEGFYERLASARAGRSTVNADVKSLRKLVAEQITIVTNLRRSL